MADSNNIQWFPGHMARTRRKITEDLKLVDIVTEIVDARIPLSSTNPVLNEIIKDKPKVILLNKYDIADKRQNDLWVNYYSSKNQKAILFDSKNGKGMQKYYSTITQVLDEKIKKWENKGMIGKSIKIMVVGIPNVGKSSFINRLIGSGKSGKAEVQDRPGVTRHNRWFNVQKGFEVLDTPGVLWPKIEDPNSARMLAYTGAIKDEIMDMETLACNFLEYISINYSDSLNTRYKTDFNKDEPLPGYGMLKEIGRKRGMLISGGEINTERASITLIDEFRSGKLGRITLEQVKDNG